MYKQTPGLPYGSYIRYTGHFPHELEPNEKKVTPVNQIFIAGVTH